MNWLRKGAMSGKRNTDYITHLFIDHEINQAIKKAFGACWRPFPGKPINLLVKNSIKNKKQSDIT